jgi:hypothetical protein
LNWTISDAAALRHKFYSDFELSASNAVVVYGGPLNGNEPGITTPFVPTSEQEFFGLNNTGGDLVLIRNADGRLISRASYSVLPSDGSITRASANGEFVAHTSVSTNAVSPGTQPNGDAFSVPNQSVPIGSATIALQSAVIRLTWNSNPGQNYTIFSAENITEAFTQRTNVTATATTSEFVELLTTSGSRFYRIRTP